ncbi:Alpha/beta hydrolase family protein [Planctomycetes bacterium CA13]|uniref:Alpha/beta hydrolase family protein n=1 Tax=Novipirellula herctigrandis TaxID=2527986 RepID=A0A5C5Z4N5_9BACT|nr:Alpha/beta hydrolase family protein [Planctomycetes bacterium CA13]
MIRKSYRVKFSSGVGEDLAGIVDRPDTSQSVPVVVLSHCFTCSKDLKAIVRIARGLSEHGIAVLRYDMTGLGGSRGDFSQTNFLTNLDDLRAAIEFAQSELGMVTTLFGHSFGGAASLAIAGSDLDIDQPTRSNLRSLISLAAPSDTDHLADRLVRMNPAIDSEGVGDVVIGGLTWSIRKQMVDNYRHYDLTRLIARVAIPTMLFQSPQDDIVGFEHAIRIMSLINVPDSNVPDSNVPDSNVPDSNVPDSNVPDSNVPDSETRQSGVDGESLASLVSLPGADHLLTSDPRDIDFVIGVAATMIQRYA